MRLSLWLFVCLLSLQLPTHGFGEAQADKTVTLSGTYTLHDIFRAIEKQTGKRIYYANAVLNDEEKVIVNVNKASIQFVLEQVLSNRNLEWSIELQTISIRKRNVDTKSSRNLVGDSTIFVTGKVINEKGEPIAGATVLVKGTQIGSTTQSDGTFIVKNVRPNSLLLISNVSFLTKELPVKGKSSIGTVSLQEYVGILDEAQIIAYGLTSRRIGTGNVSTVKSKDIEKSPVSNPLLAIAGRVPGVFIQQATGVPGTGVKILIQGQNSIGYGNDPFYVIDGVPYTSQLLPGLTSELGESGIGVRGSQPGTQGNPLSFINPQDIESIDILKDADATSIYGSRAAHGAIIITTKKGKAGKLSVNVNAQNGWGKITSRLRLLNTQQYLEMRKEAYKNDNISIPANPEPGMFDLTSWDQNRSTDWQKLLIGKTAQYTNIISTISGGNNNTQYHFSAGYQKEGSVTPSNLNDSKASLHLSVTSKSENQKFSFSVSSSYVDDNNKLARVSDMASLAFNLPPNAPNPYNPDGTLYWDYLPDGTLTINNPLAGLSYRYINATKNLIANSVVGYNLMPGLEIKSSFGYNRLQSSEVSTVPASGSAPRFRPYVNRTADFNTGEITSWIIEPQLNYYKNLWKGRFNLLLGTTIQQEDRDRQKLSAVGFSSDESMFNLKSASSVRVAPELNSVILAEYKYNALFGRINYNIEDKYILNVSMRRDGSSRFGRENKFHNFWSVAGAWLFSSEPIMRDNVNFLSFGKIRISYGTTGSDQIGDYSYLNLYQNTPTLGTNYQGAIGLEPFENFPNPYLQWEETKKFSTTLDLGFLKDRILINATYYENRCSNQLQFHNLSSVTGGTGIKTNRPIVIQNDGFELGLNTNNIATKDFSWSTSANLTIPRNKLVSITGTEADRESEFLNKPLGVFKVYHFLGVDRSTGLYTVANKEGKPTSTPDASLDKTVYIDLNPRFYGGFQNSFTYKSITLDVLFQFVKQKAENKIFGIYPGGFDLNQPASVLDRWRQPGTEALIQKYNTDFSAYDSYQIATESDKAYANASYIRLKNISLSFQVPGAWQRAIHVANARLFMNGQNLLTITNYLGADPETKSFNGMPPLKVLTLGIQVGF